MPRPVHFDITADDPERAVAFYEKVFGWKLTHWEGGGPMDYWLIETGDSEPGINGGLSRRDEGDAPATTNTIGVDSLDDAIAALEDAGYPNIQSGHGFAPNGKGGYAYFDTTHALGFILEAVEMP